jgi:hypothetical protein
MSHRQYLACIGPDRGAAVAACYELYQFMYDPVVAGVLLRAWASGSVDARMKKPRREGTRLLRFLWGEPVTAENRHRSLAKALKFVIKPRGRRIRSSVFGYNLERRDKLRKRKRSRIIDVTVRRVGFTLP